MLHFEVESELLNVASFEEKAFFLTIIHLAGRIGEVLRLRWEDVNFDQGQVVRYTRKRQGGNLEPIVAPINSEFREVLCYLWQNRLSDEWVFYNSSTKTHYKDRRKMLYRLCEKAEIPTIHYHEFRHYVASVLASSPGVTRKAIGDMLGHKNLGTTEVCLHSISETQQNASRVLGDKFKFSKKEI